MPTCSMHAAHLFGRQVQVDAQRGQHVGAAALRRGRPVAVLGHLAARAGDDERGRGGDIEGVRAVAAGAGGVQQRAPFERSPSAWLAWARMARALPVISSTVSPFMRSATR